MGRRNEWEIYGIRNVSQFCKTTIKHEATKQRSSWPRRVPSNEGMLCVPSCRGRQEETPTGHPVLQFSLFPTLSQPHPVNNNSPKTKRQTQSKDKRSAGKDKEEGRDYKILMCLSIRHKLYNYHLCIYIYYWIGRLSSCLAWPSLPLPLLEIFDL